MHLLHAARPECDQPVVAVDAEVHEVLQQPISKLLIPRGARAPCLGQHGVVGPAVANPLLAEHVLVGGAGGVPPPPWLPRELALGVGQLQEHRSCGERGPGSQSPEGAQGRPQAQSREGSLVHRARPLLGLTFLPQRPPAPLFARSASPVTWMY